jgi:hypothetical protein
MKTDEATVAIREKRHPLDEFAEVKKGPPLDFYDLAR